MSLYSSYDQNHKRWNRPQRVNGGRKRAATAKRDKFGRLLPNEGELPEPEKHGQAGGKARCAKALRDNFGKFLKGA